MICDLIARMALAPVELNISTVTSILGAPIVDLYDGETGEGKVVYGGFYFQLKDLAVGYHGKIR